MVWSQEPVTSWSEEQGEKGLHFVKVYRGRTLLFSPLNGRHCIPVTAQHAWLLPFDIQPEVRKYSKVLQGETASLTLVPTGQVLRKMRVFRPQTTRQGWELDGQT